MLLEYFHYNSNAQKKEKHKSSIMWTDYSIARIFPSIFPFEDLIIFFRENIVQSSRQRAETRPLFPLRVMDFEWDEIAPADKSFFALG